MAGARGRAGHAAPWLASLCQGLGWLRRAAVREGGGRAVREPLGPWKEELMCGWSKLHSDGRRRKQKIHRNIRFSLVLLPAHECELFLSLPSILAVIVDPSAGLSCTLSSSSTNTGSRQALEHIQCSKNTIHNPNIMAKRSQLFKSKAGWTPCEVTMNKMTVSYSPVLCRWSVRQLVLAQTLRRTKVWEENKGGGEKKAAQFLPHNTRTVSD